MKPTRLRPFDASFLALDGPTTVGHVCILCVFDGPVTLEQVHAQVAARIDRVPELRRRLYALPLGLDRPWWVDDTEFDVGRHLSERRLPPRATRSDVGVELADIIETPLRRDRPLWEAHVLHGLPGGGSAIVTKIHHCVVDGMGSRTVLQALFGPKGETASVAGAETGRREAERGDAGAGPQTETPEPPPWQADPGPSLLQRLAGAALTGGEAVASAVRLERRGAAAIGQAAARTVDGVSSWLRTGTATMVPESPPTVSPWAPAPESPFNRAVSARRSAAYGSVALSASKPLRHRLGVTVNDVVLTMTAQGLRQWSMESGDPPDESLVALVPIASGRSTPAASGGNHIGLTLCPLPTHIDDPVEALLTVHRSMQAAKSDPSVSESLLADLFTVSGATLPATLAAMASRTRLLNLVRLPFNVMVSNVPSTRSALSLGEHTMTGIHPFPPLSDGLGLTVTVEGCGGDLGLGVLTCPRLISDVWRLLDHMLEAHDALVELGGRG